MSRPVNNTGKENPVLHKIRLAIIEKPNDYSAYVDFFSFCVGTHNHWALNWLRNRIDLKLNKLKIDPSSTSTKERIKEEMNQWWSLYCETLLYDAPFNLDCYMLFLEIARDNKDSFYIPRRNTLKPLVNAIQDLADDKLDELFLSMPPRTGKSTMLLFAVTWLMGRNPNGSNLYSAYSDTITNKFYDGLLEIITDKETYQWEKIFPSALGGKSAPITNALNETIDLGKKHHYPSITCRSLYGTLNGACDCDTFLIADDLLSGIEEALNPDRLVTAWGKTSNNLLSRAKESAKILWCGTRWSIADPMGIRLKTIQEEPEFEGYRYRVISVPALNEKGESNFDYEYKVGFSTKKYNQIKAQFNRQNDIASWEAQYMQNPIERDSRLFDRDRLQFFNGNVPIETMPEKVWMAVDPAWGGGDYMSAPIGAVYGDTTYIVDWVFSNEDKSITIPRLVNKIIENKVSRVRVEANKMTKAFADELSRQLKEKQCYITVETKPADNDKSKEQRIQEHAPDIVQHLVFKSNILPTMDYYNAMEQVYTFSIVGKNIHDDAPDSLAMLIDMIYSFQDPFIIFKRRF